MRQSTKVKQLQLLLVSCAVILFVMVVNLLIEKIEKIENSPEKSVWHLECIDRVNYINYKGSFSVKFNADSTVSLCS